MTSHDPTTFIARASTTRNVGIIAALAAVAAASAPATLTGNPTIDLAERALIAAWVTFVGSHGRRWSWLVAAALLAAPARGEALALALVALVVLAAAAWPKRRLRGPGAIGLALLVNVPFRYDDGGSLTLVLAVTGLAIIVFSGARHLRRRPRRIVRASGFTVLGFVIITVLLTLGAMVIASSHVVGGTRSARQALNAARAGDVDTSSTNVATAQEEFGAADRTVSGPLTWPARLVPGVAQQVRAVSVGVTEGKRVSSSASDLVATADYDRLTYDGKLDLAQVARLSAPAANVSHTLRVAGRHLDQVRTSWLLPPLDDRLGQFSRDISDARKDAELTSTLLDRTPGLLGGQGDRRYLLVFITPAELRGAGGFIGSYAELTASSGKVRLSRSGRIVELITGAPVGTRTLSGPPAYLRRYGRYRPTEQFQDLTVSPDFPTDAQVMARLYPQSGGAEVDGVLSVDPTGLAALLKLTGPVPVEGLDQPLSATNAVDTLTRTQYLTLPDDAERGEILTSAVRATFDRLTEGPLPAPRRIAAALSPATRAGHLRLWSPQPDEQRLFERLGADGELHIPAGSDGFSVVQQNLGNNKLDAYLQRSIDYRVEVDPRTGDLRAKLTIDLANQVPSLDLPPAVVGNTRGAPKGTNVATVSIYTPHRVTASRIDGRATALGPDTEAGLNVYDTPALLIPPGGTVRIELDLSGAVDLSSGYHLTVLPQPVANPDRFRASVSFGTGAVDDRTHAVEIIAGVPLERPTAVEAQVRRSR